MTKRKKIIYWAGGSLFLTVMVLFFVIKSRGGEVEYLTEEAKVGTVARTVSATGTLTSKNKVNLNFEVTGRLEEIRVEVGQEVVEGEALALIEDDILEKEAQKAKLALDKATADAGANDDTVREAKRDVKNAKDYLEEVEDLEDQKVDAAEEAYESASDYYDDALEYYNKTEEDYGAGSLEGKSAKLTATQALNSKNAAEEAEQTAKKTRSLNVASAENSLKAAEEDLDTAESSYAEKSRNSTVETARVNYEISLANLEKATLRAPVNGVVTEINYKKGEVLGAVSAGSESSLGSVGSFGALMSRDFILEVDIPESDIAQVDLGQEAEVTFDSLSLDEKFKAKVVEIDPASTEIQDVVYYKVKVKLDDFDNRLKEGMSADVDIRIARKDDVLMIPERAINKDGEKEAVKVLLANGKTKEVLVKTGLEGDDGVVEIVSGLEAGVEVVTLEKDKKQ